MSKPVFSLYPSLLNDWHSYLTEEGYEKEDEMILFIPDEQAIIDRVNRVPREKSKAMEDGQAFEDMVLNRIPITQDANTPAVLDAQKLLPPFLRDNVRCMGVYDFGSFLVCIYGVVDVMGAGKVIDLKKNKSYSYGKYRHSHQLFYLQNMAYAGYRQMSFIVNSANQIHIENYKIDSVDWQALLNEVHSLINFIDANSNLITDKKVFSDARKEDWAKGAFGYYQPEIQTGFL